MSNKAEPAVQEKINPGQRFWGNWVVSLNKTGKIQYISKFPEEISSELINWYRKQFDGLESPHLEDCLYIMKSEATRLDSVLPNSTVAGIGILSMLATIMVVLKTISVAYISIPVVLAVTAIVALVVRYSITVDSKKRAHVTVMILVLEEYLAQHKCSIEFNNVYEKLNLISRMGHLKDKSLLSRQEFEDAKNNIFKF